MNKKFSILACSAILCATVSGCNAGDSTAPPSQTISAIVTSNSCTGMTNASTCIISVTFNTNGVRGLSLGYTPSTLPSSITSSGSFNTTFGSCQSLVATSTGSVPCPVTITYTGPNTGGTNTNLNFTLGSATSNTIKVTGN